MRINKAGLCEQYWKIKLVLVNISFDNKIEIHSGGDNRLAFVRSCRYLRIEEDF